MPLLALVSWIILPAIGGSIGGIVASNFTSPNGQQLTPLGIGLGVLVMLVFVGPF